MSKYIILLTAISFLLLKMFTPLSIYECLSISLFVFAVSSFIDDMGKKLVILDIAILLSIFTCLLMPIAGYHYFDHYNRFSRSWIAYMKVPSDEYFSFMLPATIALMLGYKLPLFFKSQTFRNQEQYMINVKAYLKDTKWQGLIMIFIGLSASLLQNVVPSVLSHIVYLLRYLMFVGIFYALYSNFPNKRIILITVFSLLVLRSIGEGMFGELIFIGALTTVLITLGNKFKFSAKLGIFLVGIFVILLIQGVKPEYRKQTWYGRNQDSKVSIFVQIFSDKLSNPSTLFDNERVMFNMYGRFNQGELISRVLNNIPKKFPYAHGETIVTSLAASVVPRFLWPDKPEAGGVYNFKRFLGIRLRGYSANISPFGEAWGNFGYTGGIIFMFAFGLFFNFCLHWLLKLAVRVPTLILWFPFLFFAAVSIETDVLMMVNSFLKAGVMAYIVYKVFPAIFKLKL